MLGLGKMISASFGSTLLPFLGSGKIFSHCCAALCLTISYVDRKSGLSSGRFYANEENKAEHILIGE